MIHEKYKKETGEYTYLLRINDDNEYVELVRYKTCNAMPDILSEKICMYCDYVNYEFVYHNISSAVFDFAGNGYSRHFNGLDSLINFVTSGKFVLEWDFESVKMFENRVKCIQGLNSLRGYDE